MASPGSGRQPARRRLKPVCQSSACLGTQTASIWESRAENLFTSSTMSFATHPRSAGRNNKDAAGHEAQPSRRRRLTTGDLIRGDETRAIQSVCRTAVFQPKSRRSQVSANLRNKVSAFMLISFTRTKFESPLMQEGKSRIDWQYWEPHAIFGCARVEPKQFTCPSGCGIKARRTYSG